MATSTLPVPAETARFPIGPLLLLGFGVFVSVTAESLPAGLLPEMSAALSVSPEQIGLLISVWAVTVIITSLPLARLFARFDRRLVVGVALALFAVANVATALAPDYGVALATRVAAAAAHGVFWAVVIVYASSLLAPSHLGRGLALVTGGGTAAAVAGLPAGAALAQLLDWRAAFAVLGVVAFALAAVIVFRMPRTRPDAPVKGAQRAPFLRDPSLPALSVLGLTCLLIALGQFAAFTFVRPYLTVAGVEDAWAPAMLFVYGTAGLAGVFAAGILADRFPRSALLIALALFAAAFGVLAVVPASLGVVIAAIAVWGAVIGGIFPVLNATLLRAASDRARTLASAGSVVLFNVGIAVGPWLGGILGGADAPQLTIAMSAVVATAATAVGAVGVVLAGRRIRAAG
jgi:MFS transporter, DHA1 family, inner membrane transport protein